jgi:hypothetical protein
MIDLDSLEILKEQLKERIAEDAIVLDTMREDVRPLKGQVRRIQPRSATAISLVGTDGGNNQLRFDPFQVQLVRIVDSSSNEYCLEVITPRTPIDDLNKRHFDSNGAPRTALGRMMKALGVEDDLSKLSPVFNPDPEKRSGSWVQVYRTMTEWAVLFDLVREKDYGTDTIIVCDGLLREKMFTEKLFIKYREGIEEGIRRQFEKNKRRIYVCGVAKHSSVIQAYKVAMAIEGVMRTAYPCYVEVPEQMEKRVYAWDEYVTLDRFRAGKMFLVKFGAGPYDPVWAVDLLLSQKGEAQTIFGYLLEDAKDGFPVPLYPQCLQKAHEHAALVDFDMELLEDQICDVMRENLGEKRWVIDELSLQETDPAARRYS